MAVLCSHTQSYLKMHVKKTLLVISTEPIHLRKNRVYQPFTI
jgi:hypothetical protein